jgi:protein TonB
MFLFNNSQDSHNKKLLSSLGGSESAAKKFSFYELLIGEEDPNAMTGLLMVLVALLHVWGVMWMLKPVETMTLAEPMMMEVSMLNAPSQKPIVAPKPPEPKKILPKKVEKKKEPVLPKPLPMAENAIPTPSAQPQPQSVVDSRPTENKAPVPETYTEANFKANYGTNPKPTYPPLAVSRGWEGKVLLRVNVSAEGLSESVVVHQSSGHDSLDDAAIEAVEKWKFIPAKKGDKAVSCTVIVPINFTLNNN